MNQASVLSAIASVRRFIIRIMTPVIGAKAASIRTVRAIRAGEMAGKAPRDKGNRFEREIVNLLRAHGIDAYRVPLSGAARGYKGDVVIRGRDKELHLEAKSRGNGFNLIYQSLGTNDFLAIKQDRKDALIVMRIDRLAKLLGQSVEKQAVKQPATTSDVPLQPPKHSPLKDFNEAPF